MFQNYNRELKYNTAEKNWKPIPGSIQIYATHIVFRYKSTQNNSSFGKLENIAFDKLHKFHYKITMC